jgi:hypothetical protein
MPKRQQISFQGVPSARAQISFACSGLSQRSQPSASSIRLIAVGDGGGMIADIDGELAMLVIIVAPDTD